MSADLHRVVIATDFSDRSLHAARWAVRHVTRDAEIVLVHVVATPELPRFIHARFPQIASVIESAVAGAARRLGQVAASLRVPRVKTDVRVGNAAERIADAARAADANLIVVGRHGDRPGLLPRIGTTADRLVRIAPAPVFLATSMRDASPRHILAGLDDADITPRVVEWVAHAIVGAAEHRNSELVVVGRTGSGLGRRMLIGSVTRKVLHNALCPVLVVIEPRAMSAAQAPAA